MKSDRPTAPAPRVPLAAVFALAATLASSVLSMPVHAQVGLYPDEIDQLDVVTIEQDGRDLFAFSSVSGNRGRLRLDIDEALLFNESRGRVAIVLTDHRAIGITANGGFAQLRYRIAERAPDRAVLGQRLAVVGTVQRVLGFVGPSGIWVEEALPPEESIEAIRAGVGVGIVVTNRRVLGLGPGTGRFASLPLHLREVIESIDAGDTLAKVRTTQRLLVFTGPTAVWTFRNRDLR